jgi:flagellar motor switch protein FliN/FliY
MSETSEASAAPGAAPGVPPVLDELPAVSPTRDAAALSAVFDLEMEVTIVLGRTMMTVQEVLALGRGSVVQLERLVGEPIDVYVGHRRFAEGEVVVIGELFGVRITRILTPASPKGGAA